MDDFGKRCEIDVIKSMSEWSFKELVKKKAKEFAFYHFLEIKVKANRSKGSELFYTDLKIQDYFLSSN